MCNQFFSILANFSFFFCELCSRILQRLVNTENFILYPCVHSYFVIFRYREKVKGMFYHAYNGYLNYAFPLDELKPITCTGQDTWGSFSLSLVDALDTLIVMGNTTEFRRAVDVVLKSVRTDANVNVSVFETNIRIIGGLISAHMLSGRVEDGWPCSGPLLRLAASMASRLLPAFNTDTGMPYGTVNLKYGVPKSETPITCTAGIGTFIVEFGTLSRLTGNPQFERVALRALETLWRTRSSISLVGNHINVQTGQWKATDTGIGAGVDSYFEYLVKGALLFQRPDLMKQFNEYASAINRYVRRGDWFLWVSMDKGAVSLPIFQSLEAFWPGLLTMVGDVEDASRIMLQYSQVIRQYGFPPEFYNIQNSASDKRSAFPLRPEIVESLMYLYRATEDPQFLELGAQIVDAIEHSAKTSCGYATINNVEDHSIEDRMESFFLAETTKYLYLLFDPENFLHNDGLLARIIDTPNGECVIDGTGGYIFNTEAHPVDPGIVHCCSAQRQAEREAVRKWEDNYDLLSILDRTDNMSPFYFRKVCFSPLKIRTNFPFKISPPSINFAQKIASELFPSTENGLIHWIMRIMVKSKNVTYLTTAKVLCSLFFFCKRRYKRLVYDDR
uniref:alpha-1,2-Mannosidase n=1 Tax=Angiostrongylus cantonensis TaxID=6313 RepID=A0A0K0DCR3_ANGCA